jgi:hypothetical protein
MLSKVLTLRINNDKINEAIEFIKDLGDHKTDSKAILSAVETFEEDHYKILKMSEELNALQYKIAKYEAYFEMVSDAEIFKKEMINMPNVHSLNKFLE